MKKIFLNLILVFAIMIMTGCKTKKNDNSFEFKLASNASTGYSWNYELSKEGIVDVSYVYDDSNCNKNVVGCGGQNVYTVKALKPGKVKLSLTYSFVGTEAKDNKTATYVITVNDDLTVSETHYGTYFKEN